MQLSDKDRLGPYQILAPIAAGGMGQVYRAHDTRLRRDVAIKVSDERFSDRFEREARAVAALNHTNICTLYDVGPNYLVMEIVEGPTLADRISQGIVPMDEALSIAFQIGAALEAAHEKGIVHRDLKPGNIKLTPDGIVKVLDFGLAKAMEHEETGSLGSGTQSPTLTLAATEAGIVLGTAAYMAPEQARGKRVDKRADIWAFGVVLYEMLTGKALFRGDTVSDTLAAVLTREPDWEDVPLTAQRLLRCCLEKDPKRRLRDIGDARLLIEDVREPQQVLSSGRTKLFGAIAVVALLALGLSLFLLLHSRQTPDRPLMRLDVDLGQSVVTTPLTVATISPDGMRLVFPFRTEGRQMLATRLLEQSKVTPIAGTEGGTEPFFSPDGQWIGFYGDDKLYKVSTQGGTPVPLAKATVPRGASWGDDDNIIANLNNSGGLWRVPAAGGTPQPLTQLASEEITHRWPQVLPGAKAVLFTANKSLNSYENATIEALSFPKNERKILWRGGYFGRFLPIEGSRGYLVYVHEGVLFGVRFDADLLKIDGTPAPLVEDLGSDPTSGSGRFGFSRTGILLYQSGMGTRAWPVEWLDDSGSTRPLLAKPAGYYSPRFSPDGNRLALSIDAGAGSDIFVYDLQQNAMSRLTFSAANNSDAVWTPDGKHIVFRGQSAGKWDIWWIRADGVGGAQKLLKSEPGVGDIGANSFSPDGRTLIYAAGGPSGGDIWTLSLDLSEPDHPKPAQPQPFITTPFRESRPAISPNGRWVSYSSNDSGPTEIYVRPFSPTSNGGGGKWQISMGGGDASIWSRNGRELFYLSGSRIMVVDYKTQGDSFIAGKARQWSQKEILSVGYTNLDLAPDGRRFAIFPQPETAEPNESRRATFLLNFSGELERRIGGRK